MSKSKRAKRTIRYLSAAQSEDQFLSSWATPLIRYTLLHNHNRCVQVSIELGDVSDCLPVASSFDALPNFLKSQLEAQKITDETKLWSQIAPLLTFIEAHLRTFEKARSFPTLFIWHSREKHRSYFLFAFVGIKMVSRTYTARELLRLRKAHAGKELYNRLYAKLRDDFGLREIFRMPPAGALPLIREEEDVEAPPQPRQIPVKSSAVQQLDGTDSEWKYRGRTDSEENLSQPICSPAGVAAQKDEGFQRFYKAVVSPTHVRVTAGGRIVPNTRAAASPTAKWPKEKNAIDLAGPGRLLNRDQPEHGLIPFPPSSFGAFPPMIPGFMPGMGPGMAPPQAAFPMVPWHMGVNMNGAFGMMPPQMFPIPGVVPGSTSSAASMKSDKHSEAGNSESASQSVRVSPPEQFDHNRPFFYNGQWMMPPGAAMFPFGMPPVPGFPFHMGGQAVMPPKFGMHPMMHLQPMKSDPSMHSHAAPNTTVPAHAAPSTPPVSSIRQSEITKRQLENLRGHLRYLEDQLQYNKHQIDEKMIEQQIQVIRHQISLFEKNLEMQLSMEQGQITKTENHGEANSSISSRMSSASNDTKQSQSARAAANYQESLSQDPESKTWESPSHLPAGSSTAKTLPLKSALKKSRSIEATKKPFTIPVSAALAPPFQPRADGPVSSSATAGSSLRSAGPLASEGSSGQSAEIYHFGEPYLVGFLPEVYNPSAIGRVDYTYGRELTEEEVRARHMYWGNAPRSLQRGYPKFDGKDFYPPSPVKEGSLDSEAASSPVAQRRRIPSGNIQSDYDLNKTTTESDPFGSLERNHQRPSRMNFTQSENLPRLDSPMSSSFADANLSPKRGTSLAAHSYEDFRKSLGEIEHPSGSRHEKSSSESGEETHVLFKGRKSAPQRYVKHSQRSMQQADLLRSKNTSDMWQNLLRKGKSSGAAVPGKISSMTAQGVLPNYTGHATKSLTPTIANTSVPPKGSAGKLGEPAEPESVAQNIDKVENRRPDGPHAKNTLHRVGF
ncbi:hypothetical protein HIM_00032 [Hirsutella minnesotensis 3608]|nr:hypothetical protein HIM_00032 [Hirsutella minnesotensis 3608]